MQTLLPMVSALCFREVFSSSFARCCVLWPAPTSFFIFVCSIIRYELMETMYLHLAWHQDVKNTFDTYILKLVLH